MPTTAAVYQKIKGKIFQPFFNTKPAGQDTRLGLEVKRHVGGQMTMGNKGWEVAAFTIMVPQRCFNQRCPKRMAHIKHYIKIIIAATGIALLTFTRVFGQADTVTTVTRLPADGFLLDKGWTYLPDGGRRWNLVDPAAALPLLPSAISHGAGWLQIKFRAGQGVLHRAVLLVTQAPAVRIYLDGHTVCQRGVISEKDKTGRPWIDRLNPVELDVTDTLQHTLAVRYANGRNPLSASAYCFPPFFSARLMNIEQLVNNINRERYLQCAKLTGASILLMLAILHAVFFSYNRGKRANFYFAGYAFSFACYVILHSTYNDPKSLDTYIVSEIFLIPLYLCACLFAIRALCMLFEFNTGRPYRLLIMVLVCCCGIWTFGNVGWYHYLTWAVIAVLSVIQMYLAVKAVVLRLHGSLLVAAGFLAAVCGVSVTMYLQIKFTFPLAPLAPFLAGICLGILGPALCISIFLGRDFGDDSRMLGIKLKEIEALSARSLAQEQQKSKFEKEVIMLEGQALRAQMNPHFIFNCLNSIKALILEDKKQYAVDYLTTFSKLIRSQLNNTQEISLHDELQTCQLYIKMETLRFGSKIQCSFLVDAATDTKAVLVPPLFLQPVIENAIWHGILPREANGKVFISVEKKQGILYCVVDDNGIGRRQSMENKPANNQMHQSKGIQLMQDRLKLYNMKNNRHASVQVIDKYDGQGKATGTQVVFSFALDG